MVFLKLNDSLVSSISFSQLDPGLALAQDTGDLKYAKVINSILKIQFNLSFEMELPDLCPVKCERDQ